MFSNLVELCVVSTIELSCKTLLAILQNSPFLRVINFEGVTSFWPKCLLLMLFTNPYNFLHSLCLTMQGVGCVPRYFANHILDPLPMCFRTHLKRIKIDDFCGSERQLHAIKILLQAASVLSTLRIRFHPCHFYIPTKLEKSKKFCKQITSFPRGSTDCVIEFEYV